ncbi:MAG: SoxR reducing system RseC family protein [Magnetococcales bacterium]|nr:SoxR reducing system RseC family protein [Magnetococcales bacterium]
MLREEGVVVAVEGEYAIVANQRRGGCGGCHAEASCGAMSGGLGRQSIGIRARNLVHADVGERVVLEIAEGELAKASFLVYGMPVLALVLVGVVARSLAQSLGVADSESVGALAGLLALVGCFYGLYRYNKHIENDDRHQPVISRILTSASGHAGVCS